MTGIETRSGIMFDPLNPDPELINLDDIAIALSRIPRFGGHTSRPYSVLEHSIYCYWEARDRGYGKETQKLCFCHDWSEAYVIDIPKPLKIHLPEYNRIEGIVQKCIYKKFNIKGSHRKMKLVDDAMGRFEAQQLMASAGQGARWAHLPTRIDSKDVKRAIRFEFQITNLVDMFDNIVEKIM